MVRQRTHARAGGHSRCAWRLAAVRGSMRPCRPAGPARIGVLGMSTITYLGLTKLNLFGEGITETVKGLWRRPAPPPKPLPKK